MFNVLYVLKKEIDMLFDISNEHKAAEPLERLTGVNADVFFVATSLEDFFVNEKGINVFNTIY